jgi:hypothetical protein
MKTVEFIPYPGIKQCPAVVLLEYFGKAVLLCQDRICVAAKDGEVYRPYPNSQSLDLQEFIQKTY